MFFKEPPSSCKPNTPKYQMIFNQIPEVTAPTLMPKRGADGLLINVSPA